MRGDASIAALGVHGQAAAFADGSLTPSDAVEAYTRRIHQFNPALNAFLDLRLADAAKEARDATERWRTGAALSPIDGVAFGVKANIAVGGLPWHGGIAAYRGRVAGEDAACVAALRRAGAIPLGILNMHEGALGATTDNPHFGRCYNPWGENKTPGGSSGGSGASVAAGLCAFALGTDTMGSVRIPSAYCSVAGLKPSYGAVPGDGLIDLSPTLDHIGPHARTAADIRLVLPHLRGQVNADVDHQSIRIGIADWGGAVDIDEDVAVAFAAATDIIMTYAQTKSVDISSFDFGALRRRGLLVSEVEGHHAHQVMLAKDPSGFSDEFRGMLEWGIGQNREKIDAAYDDVRAAGKAVDRLFDDVDVIITPTAPQGPFSFGETVPANQADFTCIANFAGAPAVAVPASTAGAPPASIQFIARKGMDHVALAAAAAFEDARGPAPFPPDHF